jgi:hypothetical protein
MPATQIRKCDLGTKYAEELTTARQAGHNNCTDAQAMTMFCEDIMQRMVGAHSPRLLWEGAQKAGLTTLQLHALCARRDHRALNDLQFG